MKTTSRNWEQFALLLIDVQQDFWSKKRDRNFPEFTANISRLLDFCRADGLEVVHLRASFKPDMSDWMPNHRLFEQIPCVAGTKGEKTLPFALETCEEVVITKQTYDGFHCPDLLPLLHKKKKRFILTAGLVTSICVLFTTVSATQLGFLTAVVEDCCADEPISHNRTLEKYQFVFERTTVPQMVHDYPEWVGALGRLG